jgi:hypothetical protein
MALWIHVDFANFDAGEETSYPWRLSGPVSVTTLFGGSAYVAKLMPLLSSSEAFINLTSKRRPVSFACVPSLSYKNEVKADRCADLHNYWGDFFTPSRPRVPHTASVACICLSMRVFPLRWGLKMLRRQLCAFFWAFLLRQTLLAGFPFVHNPVVRELALQSRGEPVFKFKAVGLRRRTLLQLLDTLLQGGDVLILASQ